MPDFRISKRQVQVDFIIAGREHAAAVFLSPFADHHEGAETVSDLLASTEPFLPAEEGGVIRCIPKEAIELCLADPTDALGPQRSPVEEHEVQVTLLAGRPVAGTLRYSEPRESARVVDFLNSATDFFPLHLSDRVALVNRRHVAFVSLATEAPKSAKTKAKGTSRQRGTGSRKTAPRKGR